MRGGRGKRARVSKVLQVDPVAASDMQFGSGSQCVEIAASSTGGDAYKQSSSGPQSVETAASLVRVYYVYCVLIASLLRCCCDYGDSTAIPRRPNQDSARTQSFCDCFVHVQNSRRRSATLCVLGFLATTSLRPCCVHGDCAASWVVARSQ